MSIAYDQSQSTNINGSNTATVNVTTAAANEYMLLVSDVSNDTATVSSITDGIYTWVKIIELSKGTGNGWVSIWRTLATSTRSGASVTVNYAGGFPQASVVISSFSGVDTTGTNGSGATGAIGTGTTSTSSSQSNSVTTTRANSLVVGAIGQDSTGSYTAGASQTINGQDLSSGGFSMVGQVRQNSVTASSGTNVTASTTSTNSAVWGAVAIEIKAPVVVALPVSAWIQPKSQPLRNRVLRRQQPSRVQPPKPLSVAAFNHPTSQPLRSRTPKRQQPIRTNGGVLYAANVVVVAPLVTTWVHPVNQPLKSRVGKRLQLPRVQPSNPPQASEPPYLSYWKQPTGQPLKSRISKRQQPIQVNSGELYAANVAPAAPSIATWKQPVNQPVVRRGKRIEISGGEISSSVNAPYVSYFVHPTNQPLRNRIPKRQQPIRTNGGTLYPANVVAATPSVASWTEPTSQPIRRPKRQQVGRVLPPSPLPSAAPYLSYWKQPIWQPLRRVRRQQPNVNLGGIIFAGTTVVAPAPIISSWKQPVNQPLKNRVLRRLQLPIPQPSEPPQASEPVYLSYWVHPANQPLKSRVPKRLQVNRTQPPYPPLTSAAPYLSYWKQLTNQPLKARVSKRQQPQRFLGGFIFSDTRTAPLVDSWNLDISQPIRSRVPKRLQLPRIQPPYPAIPSQAPYLSYWVQPKSQPVRSRYLKRQQPMTDKGALIYADNTIVNVVPVLSSWINPVNQPLKSRVPKRLQVFHTQPPYPPIPTPPPAVSYWVHSTNQPLKSRVLKRQQPESFLRKGLFLLVPSVPIPPPSYPVGPSQWITNGSLPTTQYVSQAGQLALWYLAYGPYVSPFGSVIPGSNPGWAAPPASTPSLWRRGT